MNSFFFVQLPLILLFALSYSNPQMAHYILRESMLKELFIILVPSAIVM